MTKKKKKKKRPTPRRMPKLISAWRQAHKPGEEAEPVLPGLLKWCTRYGLYVVLAMALVYAAAFCVISHTKYRQFNYSDFDLAIFSNAMWNTAHGDFMFTEIRSGCFFKDHVPMILLALVPLYRLFPSPLTLLYAQSILLAAGAVPLFLLARREINGVWGILLAVMYLLYPALGFINLFEFHALAFVPVLLLFALYFFRIKKYVPFCVFAGLSMLCREDVALTVMMIGLYALIGRRRWHWIVAPATAGLIWFAVCLCVIIPHYNEGANIFGALYGEMGETPAQVVKTAVTKPGKTLRIALKKDPNDPRVDKPAYLKKVFTPVGYLAFANPEALLIAAPQFALNLLVDTNKHAPPPTIYFQYTATLIPVIFFSSVLGLARLLRIRVLAQFWYLPGGIVLAISAVTWILWAPQVAPATGPPRNMASTQIVPRADAHYYDELLAQVPDGVPTVATFRFLPRLSNRRVLASFHYAYMGHEKVAIERAYMLPDEVEYALLDLSSTAAWAQAFGREARDHFRRLLEEGDWGIVDRRGPCVLLRKNAPELPKLIQRVDELTVAHRFTCQYDVYVKLLGVDVEMEPLGDATQVRLRLAWEVVTAPPGPIEVTFALINPHGIVEVTRGSVSEPVVSKGVVGNFALSPESWDVGDRFETEHAMIVPGDVPEGTYGILLSALPMGFVPLPPKESVQGDTVTVEFLSRTGDFWSQTLPRHRHIGRGYCFVGEVQLGTEPPATERVP